MRNRRPRMRAMPACSPLRSKVPQGLRRCALLLAAGIMAACESLHDPVEMCAEAAELTGDACDAARGGCVRVACVAERHEFEALEECGQGRDAYEATVVATEAAIEVVSNRCDRGSWSSVISGCGEDTGWPTWIMTCNQPIWK